MTTQRLVTLAWAMGGVVLAWFGGHYGNLALGLFGASSVMMALTREARGL